MGEKRRRAVSAFASGAPVPRPLTCPGCGSSRIHVRPAPPALARHLDPAFGRQLPFGVCMECRACWEALPEMYVEDPVCAEPCDNCAFRPGSPEQADRAKWRELLDQLQQHEAGIPTASFYCHKNVPIDVDRGPGNFLFPTLPSGGWDTARMRTCVGFLRMVWARRSAAAAQLDKVGKP